MRTNPSAWLKQLAPVRSTRADPMAAGTSDDLRRRSFLVLALPIVGAAIALHLFRIAGLPMGFYPDESSIGYNAWSIAGSGRDEHGVEWPLYFRAFGEYKNPVYIYFVALLYKLVGFSEWTTRFASAVCWFVGSAFLFALGCRLFRERAARWYLLICLGFTPWLFSLSRVSFELISVYPLLAAHLWAIHRAWEDKSPFWAAFSGISIGLAFYAYSTFRLLGFLYVLIVLICYADKRYWRLLVSFLAVVAATLAPLVIYLQEHASNLTGRFGTLTYLRDPSLSLVGKAQIFIDRYLDYFGPTFLALHGDPNRRHHTGYGGELLLPTAVLLFAGLAYGIVRRGKHCDRFVLVLIAGLLVSPLAAALTLDHYHSLRAFSLVIFAVLLSTAGLQWIQHRLGERVALVLVVATAVHAALYVWNYFAVYPAASVRAFENYGFKQALERATTIATGRVVIDSADNQPYISALFLGALMRSDRKPTVIIGGRDDVRPGDAFIFADPSFAYRRDGLPANGLYAIQGVDDIHKAPTAPLD